MSSTNARAAGRGSRLRRTLRRLSSSLPALALVALASCGGELERPNVLLVTLDTTRADALGCLGGPDGASPRLDALAAEGALFTSAYSDSNVTNPSHLSILTGMRLVEHGVYSNLAPFPIDADGLPQAFARKGYRTGAVLAVRHLADAGWQGFETLNQVPGELRAELVTEAALDWLDEDDERPFFLWVHYFDPHTMYAPPPYLAGRFYSGNPAAGEGAPIVEHEYFDEPRNANVERLARWLRDARDREFPRAMYQSELLYTDGQIGRLLDALGASGREDSTAVVVTADHGEAFGEHGIYYDHKGLYEGQVHVPLIVRVPDEEPVRWDGLVSTLDVAPTLAELCDLRLVHELAGRNLLPVVRGEDPGVLAERSELVLQHAHNHQVALREGRWKLIWPIGDNRYLPDEPQLFDLEADPGEARNLADEHPERVAAMRARLEPWIEIGPVKKGARPTLSSEALRELQELGYIEPDSGG